MTARAARLIVIAIVVLGSCASEDEEAAPLPPRDERVLYRIEIEDMVEAALIKQEIGIEPALVRGGFFYYFGDDHDKRLRAVGYVPRAVDPNDVLTRLVRVEGGGGEKTLDDTGASVLLRERSHWVVRATGRQARVLARLGYRVTAPRTEPRPRYVRVYIDRKEQVRSVAPLLADIFSAEPEGERFVVHGAAWDDRIDRLRAEEYEVRVLPWPKR